MPTEQEVLEYAKGMHDRWSAHPSWSTPEWENLFSGTKTSWIKLARHELANRLVPLGTVEELQKFVGASYKTWLKSDTMNYFYYVLTEDIIARYGSPAQTMTHEAKAVIDAAVEWIMSGGSVAVANLIRAVKAYQSPDSALSAADAILKGDGWSLPVPKHVLAKALKAAKEATP